MRRCPTALALLVTLAFGCGREAPPTPVAPPPARAGEASTTPIAAQPAPEASPAPPTGPAEAAGVPYLERVTGGAAANEALPLVIALHGLGDRPERFIALFGALRARARVIAPYGEPYGAGFSFFPIVSRVDPDALAPGITRAVTRLTPLITAVARARPTQGKPIVTGFSQGGMLSFALAVLHPEIVGEALPISGFLTVKLLAPAPAPAPARGGAALSLPPIVAFHGDADPVVPIAADRLGVARLREAGGRAELHEYPGVVHTVSPEMLRDIEAALEAAVSRAGR